MSQIMPIEQSTSMRISTKSCSKSIRSNRSINLSPDRNVPSQNRRFFLFSKNPVVPEINLELRSRNFRARELEILQAEALGRPQSQMSITHSIGSVREERINDIEVYRSQSQERLRNDTPTTLTTIEVDMKRTQKDFLNKKKKQNNKENKYKINNHVQNEPNDDDFNGDARSMENLDHEKNVWLNGMEPIAYHEPVALKKKHEVKQKHQRSRRCLCCSCSPCCALVSILIAVIVLGVLTALIVTLILLNQKTVTTTETTSTTITTATISTTTSSTTSSSTSTTSTTTSSTTSTATTSTTTSAITTTTSTTTTAFTCGQSCLNQSWIDTSGGLALWPFDGTHVDVTGSYDAIFSPNLPTFVTGYTGQAASFSASATQSVYTSFIPLNNASFTIEAWIKPTGFPNPSDMSILGLCASKATSYCLHINIRAKKLYCGFYLNDVPGATTLIVNQWIHVAFVFDRITKRQTIYLNGIQDGQATATAPLLVTARNVTIGTNEILLIPKNYFQGYIDQLSINKRAKSSCEILERATLAAHFKFDTTSAYNDSGPNTIATKSSDTSIITGYNNQAISLNGTLSSYFQTWGFTSLGVSNQPFSMTMWIKPEILSGTLVHLSTSSLGTGSTCFPLLGFASNGSILAQVLISSGVIATAIGPTLPISSSWIPVAQTWSSMNGLQLYVNNTLVSSISASTFLGSGTTPNYLTLGNCLNGCSGCSKGLVTSAGPFRGAIDDWRIYSRELTWSDICALFIGV